jgi:hypothetical protein
VTQVMTIPRAVPVIPPPQTIPQKRVVITALLSKITVYYQYFGLMVEQVFTR